MTGFVAVRAPVGRLLRSELRWIFRRPRTLVLLGLIALYPVAFGIGSQVIDAPVRADGRQSILAAVAGNALALPVITLTTTLAFFLPLICTMTAADALAGESANGTLRGLLLAPVSRVRLLAVKAFGVAAVAVVATVLTAVVAVATGLLLSGTGSLVTLSGTTLPLTDALGRVGVTVLWVVVQLWAIGAVALAVSAATEHPLLVMAGVIGGIVVSSLLGTIQALHWLHPFLLTETWESVVDVLRDPVPAEGLTVGLLRAVCYTVIGYSLALARIVTRDD